MCEVCADRLLGGVRVALRNGVDDRAMLGQRLLGSSRPWVVNVDGSGLRRITSIATRTPDLRGSILATLSLAPATTLNEAFCGRGPAVGETPEPRRRVGAGGRAGGHKCQRGTDDAAQDGEITESGAGGHIGEATRAGGRLQLVRFSSERARQAAPQDCSFANKQEAPAALVVVVRTERAPCDAARRLLVERSGVLWCIESAGGPSTVPALSVRG